MVPKRNDWLTVNPYYASLEVRSEIPSVEAEDVDISEDEQH